MLKKNLSSTIAHRLAWPIILAAIGLLIGSGVATWLLVLRDRLGHYRNTTVVADLDGDGDEDVVAAHVRWESTSTSFAVVNLWINQGAGHFVHNKQTLPAGFTATAGDIDSDGDTDLLLLDGYQVVPVINQGGIQGGLQGSFSPASAIRAPQLWPGHVDMGGSLAIGDLNNDRAYDGYVASCCYLAMTGQASNAEFIPFSSWLWLDQADSQGKKAYHTQSLNALDGIPLQSIALGDLDRDGDLDIFAAIGSLTTAIVDMSSLILLNDGMGNFSDSGQHLNTGNSTAIALGDIDKDGDLDALLGTQQGAFVCINQGGAQLGRTGVFVIADQLLASNQTKAVFLHDMNGDTTLDALIAGGQRAEIWWNDGSATFRRAGQQFSYSKRHALAVSDFDGDGHADIFVGAYTEDYRIWFGRGEGFFQAGD